MADVNVRVEHGQEDTTKVEKGVAKVLDKMSDAMGFTVGWSGSTANLSGKAIKKGTIVVDDTAINVEITLALFAKPMKGMIETKIDEAFRKSLGRS